MRLKLKSLIIHESDDLYAINKPAGIASLHDRVVNAPSVIDEAKKYNPDSQLCHRLDKETSGILLIAKNPETYRDISILFEKRKIQKTYWAIVEGKTFYENHEIDLSLSQTARGRAKLDKLNGKPAQTVVTTIENFKGFSLVECKPLTGRLHQIRIHLSSQGTPIAGDITYGGKEPYLKWIKKNFNSSSKKEERPMISRSALHARGLQFTLNKTDINLEAELPKDMQVFLTLLRKYDV